MKSPILSFREAEQLTQQQLADEAGINLQAVFLCEKGVYPEVLPALLKTMRIHGYKGPIQTEYQTFVHEKRVEFGIRHDLSSWRVSDLGPPVGHHPLVKVRLQLDLSRMKFCKDLCVHPAQELRVERGKAYTMGEQLMQALLVAGLEQPVLDELEQRTRDFAEGVVSV